MSVQDDPYIVVPFNPLPSETQGPEEVEKEKQYIRKKILPASNMQLIEDEEAMRKIRELGSDLNINAFACNFKIDGKPNEDVEEANYLNSRLYQSFSITTPKKPANTIPLYLSATTLGMEDYGHCCTHFKQRIGLETESEQDLFVLRNVVMSPFQTAGGFVSKIADIFQKTLERETEVCCNSSTTRLSLTKLHCRTSLRGTPSPQKRSSFSCKEQTSSSLSINRTSIRRMVASN
jgi:hypothetical protein